jgi:hypothetical protein
MKHLSVCYKKMSNTEEFVTVTCSVMLDLTKLYDAIISFVTRKHQIRKVYYIDLLSTKLSGCEHVVI